MVKHYRINKGDVIGSARQTAPGVPGAPILATRSMSIQVDLNEDHVIGMVYTAARSKSGRCVSGPVKVTRHWTGRAS